MVVPRGQLFEVDKCEWSENVKGCEEHVTRRCAGERLGAQSRVG